MAEDDKETFSSEDVSKMKDEWKAAKKKLFDYKLQNRKNDN